ncbi:MAG: cortex morphogenetic protein CmpA [Paenibacillus sp.]|nr:cortex morphogenetic protein CmpA [Paenibacillus sp.]
MPEWLCNQLMRAFLTKNVRKIKLLGDCWYFYRTQGMNQERHSEVAIKKTDSPQRRSTDKPIDITQV